MNPNKALWEKGDFTRIAESMRESGEALVKGLGITKGLKVLDLGCGDGTTALPEAKLGAEVLGVDPFDIRPHRAAKAQRQIARARFIGAVEQVEPGRRVRAVQRLTHLVRADLHGPAGLVGSGLIRSA